MMPSASQWRRRDLLRSGLGTVWLSAIPGALLKAGSGPALERPHRLLAEGLRFPEGPVALADGSVILVEIARQTLIRVHPDGSVQVVAELRGGPNGAALGPDGACYVCNNGGGVFAEVDGILLPTGPSPDYDGGWIERVDLDTGKSEVLFRKVGERSLSAPNDLVFDGAGGFWFTDLGKADDRGREHGAVCYALADGSSISQAVYPIDSPNGIALSPDGKTLFVAELYTGRLIAFDVSEPGKLASPGGILPGRFIAAGPGRYLFDSMAVEANGTICIAAPLPGEIVCFSPDGGLIETVRTPGPLPTNLCFGGPGMQTAYITLAGKGQLIAMDWPRSGLPLEYLV